VIRIQLIRFETGDQGTFGRLSFGQYVRYSGELPDRANQSNISCIPPGIYSCVWNYSGHFKRFMYQILSVPHRTGIRIHSANYMGDRAKGFRSQLYGCISLGTKLGWMDGQKAILSSRPAVSLLETAMNRQSFDLEIVDGIHP